MIEGPYTYKDLVVEIKNVIDQYDDPDIAAQMVAQTLLNRFPDLPLAKRNREYTAEELIEAMKNSGLALNSMSSVKSEGKIDVTHHPDYNLISSEINDIRMGEVMKLMEEKIPLKRQIRNIYNSFINWFNS